MHPVSPKVFLVGETRIIPSGVQAYLQHIGAPNWTTDATDYPSALTEIMGRGCYKSWEAGLNPNVTRVRQGNNDYLKNIIKVGHGSVMEHATLNFVFCDVSRVFTHELVRHRAGTAVSQESLRFVRLTDLGQWLPTCIEQDAAAVTIFAETFKQLEDLQRQLAEHFKLDDPEVPFSVKKEITSAMRRLAPEGLATVIGWSANIRAIRHCLEMRTDPHAEEEIRVAFAQVGRIVTEKYPALFSDYTIEEVAGIPHYKTQNRKI